MRAGRSRTGPAVRWHNHRRLHNRLLPDRRNRCRAGRTVRNRRTGHKGPVRAVRRSAGHSRAGRRGPGVAARHRAGHNHPARTRPRHRAVPAGRGWAAVRSCRLGRRGKRCRDQLPAGQGWPGTGRPGRSRAGHRGSGRPLRGSVGRRGPERPPPGLRSHRGSVQAARSRRAGRRCPGLVGRRSVGRSSGRRASGCRDRGRAGPGQALGWPPGRNRAGRKGCARPHRGRAARRGRLPLVGVAVGALGGLVSGGCLVFAGLAVGGGAIGRLSVGGRGLVCRQVTCILALARIALRGVLVRVVRATPVVVAHNVLQSNCVTELILG